MTLLLAAALTAAPAQVDTVASFGGLDAEGGLETHGVRAAAMLPTSAVVAQNGGVYELRLDGSAVRMAGEGDGPGEVRLAWTLGVSGDVVWYFDARHRRLTTLNRTSGRIETARYPSIAISAGQLAHRLSDGSVLTTGSSFLAGGPPPRYRGGGVEVTPDSLLLTRRHPDGRTEALRAVPSRMRYRTSEGEARPPGHPRLLHRVVGDRVLLARSERPDFEVLDVRTGERWASRVSLESRPLDRDAHAERVRRFLDAPHTSLFSGGGPPSREVVAARREVLAEAGDPDRAEIIDDAVLARSGEVWLREAAQGLRTEAVWHVVSDGAPERVVRLAADLEPLAIDGNRMVALSRDELNVVTLHLLRVRTPENP